MKNYYLLTTAFVAVLTATAASAQEHPVNVDFDKKVIKVDSLGLPQSFKASGVLRMLPELLERPGSTLISEYDVQVEDMSVGNNADIVLKQLQLADIDRIEISENPISSYQSNGQGGSINIVLKKKNKGTWGSASVSAFTPTDVMPQFLINNNTGNFIVRGMLLGELNNYTTTVTTDGADSKTDRKFSTELARVYMEYHPSNTDAFKLNLSESFSRNKLQFPSMKETDVEKATTLKALFNYQHTFNPQSNLQVEVQYNYTPNRNKYDAVPLYDDYYANESYNINTNNVGGKIEYKRNLLSLESKDYANVTVGVNGNYTVNDKDYDIFETIYNSTLAFSTQGKTTHVMPYLNFESRFGQVKFKVVGEYQYYKYNVRRNEEQEHSVDRKDFTGKMMLAWLLTPNRNLRFIIDRKLARPSNEQIYPETVYDVDQDAYVKGNLDLKPTLSHEFALDYISYYKWGEHKLTFNAGLSYNLIDDIINSKTEKGSAFYGFGLTQEYNTYNNLGDNKLLNANIMALYDYKDFDLSFAANIFRNDMHVDDDNDGIAEAYHSYYYNLSLMPSITLKNEWMSSLNISYYSKVKHKGNEQGDCLAAILKVGKNFGKLNVNWYGCLSVTGKTKDYTGNSVKTYNLVDNSVGIGCMYHF